MFLHKFTCRSLSVIVKGSSWLTITTGVCVVHMKQLSALTSLWTLIVSSSIIFTVPLQNVWGVYLCVGRQGSSLLDWTLSEDWELAKVGGEHWPRMDVISLEDIWCHEVTDLGSPCGAHSQLIYSAIVFLVLLLITAGTQWTLLIGRMLSAFSATNYICYTTKLLAFICGLRLCAPRSQRDNRGTIK